MFEANVFSFQIELFIGLEWREVPVVVIRQITIDI